MGTETILSDVDTIETLPPEVRHPRPYEILTDPDQVPPGEVRNIWSTILNITDYAIWVEYEDLEGEKEQSIELVTFTDSLLSLIFNNGDPFLHQMDVDGDGDDDIEVGLTLEFEFNGAGALTGIGFGSSQLSSSKSTLSTSRAQLTRPGTISRNWRYPGEGIRVLRHFGDRAGESYVWIIDSVFTQPPREFTLDVGIERIYLDISEASSEFLTALTFGIFNPNGDPSESGISIASLSAPYVIGINNPIEDQCPDRYDPIELTTLPSMEISCGVRAGFGYIHYSPPDQDQRDIWEVAYIDIGIHPESTNLNIPRRFL